MSAFGRLIDSYEDTAEQFKLTRAREIFLKKMMSEEDPSNEPEVSPADLGQDRETWDKFLAKVEDCRKYSSAIDKENKANQLMKNYNNVNFDENIAQMEEELKKIETEQRAVDALIAQRTERQQQLLREREEAERPAEVASPGSRVQDDAIKAENIRLRALLTGLESLTQFYVKDVSHNVTTGDLVLQCRVGVYDTMFVLDANKKLCGMNIESADSHINAADVLAEAQMMAAPQDLRYAVFYIGAAQKAPVALKADVAELRKSCIVQPNAQRKDGCFDITFSNGVTIQVSSHPCYSSVPNSIHIDSISGIGGWISEELAYAQEETNVNSAMSLPAAVSFLLQILDSK